MSVYSEALTDSNPPSSKGSDLFGDEEKTEVMLKSLISARGLQDSWGSILKRQGRLEKTLKKNSASIEFLQKDYVPRAEYHDLVEIQHGSKIVEHDNEIARLGTVTVRLTASEEDHQKRILELERRMAEEERLRTELDAELKRTEERSASRFAQLAERLDRTRNEIMEKVDLNAFKIGELKESTDAGFRGAAEARQELENRMHEFVDNEFMKLQQMLEQDYISEVKMLDQQQLIKGMVKEEFIDPLRTDLAQTNETAAQLAMQLNNQTGDLHRLLRGLEGKVNENNAKITKAMADAMDDIETRAKRSELEEMGAEMRREMQNVQVAIDELKARTVAKLNEFVDHFGKVHESIDDHEHCLKHHAEELENRATKYDLLVQQNRIDKCVLKEDVDMELGELKQVVEWQTDKIENFALTTAMMGMGGGGGGKKGRKTNGKRKSVTAASEDTETDVGDGSPGAQKSPKKADEAVEEEEDDEDDEEMGIVFLVRSQLESLSLGVVSLAQCTLREPKLGESRQSRLEREQELLEHLKATRHWITHKTAPGGWDPVRLLSLGLNVSHPADHAPKGVLPQIPLSVLQDGKASPKTALVKAGRHILVSQDATQKPGPSPPAKPKEGANTAPKQGLAGLRSSTHDKKELPKVDCLPMMQVVP